MHVLPARNGKFRISYHATGRVNFHEHSGASIFCEPIYAISRAQNLAYISVPKFERLTTETAIRESDTVLEMSTEADQRLTFHLIIAPENHHIDHHPLAVVTYRGWFSIAIVVGAVPFGIPNGEEEKVIVATPEVGLFDVQQAREDQALIRVHQKRINSVGQILYWKQSSGEYRLIFSVPMRRPPGARIRFKNPETTAKVERPVRIAGTGTSEIRFTAWSRGGRLKSFQPIESVELDAEL
jgi:hypothetical protein